ncbi:transglutaminase family protein [Nocardioides flavescens]|uniref:Transglutaminase family protein n=1 Tax=Nocardioides flavescens TaxID=2691959 RepID=A0A6L7EPF1_9ACTN|nr:transglutaminase family protein [Nocardioides flavescens]MXG88480.1 transglutaminase family protein [Nocardioides flavescens]
MSMQLRVVHTTRFSYDGPAVASYNQARLTPVTTPEQIVVHARLEVSPKPWTYDYRDYFGNHVTAFEVVDPHETMTVTATSTVQVNRSPAAAPSATWEELAGREVADRWTEYLVLPPRVAPPEDLSSRLETLRADAATPGAAASELFDLLGREVEHRPGATHAGSTAAESWAQRAGVCQDTAHLAIGGLRSLGVPARFVTGWLHPSPEPVVGEPVGGSPHAWLEWWDHGWRSYDVTHGTEPDDRYVVVATGRDHDDVTAISGIYSGSEARGLDVSVEVTRVS